MKTQFNKKMAALAVCSIFSVVTQAQDSSLDTVVVTATGYEQKVIDAPASITVISKEQLEGKTYRDISEALQDIPGVTVEGGAGGKVESTAIYIRGMSEDYTRFMVNGRGQGSSQAYYNGFGSANEIGWLPPLSAIERIEVIRGPMSSLYGSDAMGGVINIITKKISPEWTGSLGYDTVQQDNGDSGASHQERYYLSGPVIRDRLGVALYGSRFKRDEDKFTGGFRGKEKQDNTLRVNWLLNETHSLEAEYGKAEQENTGTAGLTGATSLLNEREHFALTHEANWGGGKRSTSFVTREDVSIENGSNVSDYIRTTYNTKTVLPIGAHVMTIGAERLDETVNHDPDRFHGPAASMSLERWNMSLFGEDEWFVNDKLTLTGGLRFNRNEHYGNELIPRAYAVYKLAPRWTVKGGIASGYKMPTLKQADSSIGEQSGGNGRSVDIGNYSLKPESSRTAEIGTLWQSQGGDEFGVTAYFTDFKDKISSQRICSSATNTDGLCIYNGKDWMNMNVYTNVSSAELRGIESHARIPFGSLVLNLNYTYSDSEQKSGANIGKPLNNLPKHMANLGVDWKYTDLWAFWGKAKYKGKSLEDGTSQRPAYTLVDAGVKYRWSKTINIYGGIYNLLDKTITSADGFGKTLDGRRYNIGLNVGF